MIEREIEETGTESGRKRMNEAGRKIETMIRKRVPRGTRREIDLGSGQRRGGVRVK